MRRVSVWLLWFAGLFGLWLLLVGTVQELELIAGLCAATIGAFSCEVARAQAVLRFRLEQRWLRRLWRPLWRVVPDFLLLMAGLVRGTRGTFRELEFPVGGERGADVGRRAFAVVAPSLAPNRLVVDVDPQTGGALVHDLVPEAASPELL